MSRGMAEVVAAIAVIAEKAGSETIEIGAGWRHEVDRVSRLVHQSAAAATANLRLPDVAIISACARCTTRPDTIVATTRGRSGADGSTMIRSARWPRAMSPRSVNRTAVSRRSRHQHPGLLERNNPARRQRKGRQQRGRIVVIRGQHRAKTPPDHLGRVDPAGVASAAHHIRRAEHDVVALRSRFLGSLHRGRKFRQSAAERAKPAPLLGAGIVVGQQRSAGRIGCRGQPLDRGGDLAGPALRALHHRQEVLPAQSGTLDHRRQLVGPVRALDDAGHMIVEGDRVDAAVRRAIQ